MQISKLQADKSNDKLTSQIHNAYIHPVSHSSLSYY